MSVQHNYYNIVGSNMLRPLDHPVVTVMLKMVKFFMQQFVDVTWCCSHLARFMQQCCAQACALARVSIPNTLHSVAKRAWHVGWTMLQYMYVAFNCCDCLAGGCKCWANNVVLKCCDRLVRALHLRYFWLFQIPSILHYFLFLVGFSFINIYTFTVL